MLKNEFNRRAAQPFCFRRSPGSNIGFNCVGKRIHTCGGRDMGWQAGHDQGVQRTGGRDQAVVDNHLLGVCLIVRGYRHKRYLRTRSGGCGNGEKGQRWQLGLAEANKFLGCHIIGGCQGHNFSRIHR